ncbi:MAG: enoyl-CoA hydratase/isomerase family protein [Desulfarculaceae bacterium]|jgi:enoyl-CoA hydratase
MSDFGTLIYEKQGAVAWLTLNRPEALNVYNLAMRDDLYEVAGAIQVDDEVRVVVIKGAGDKAFCAGADLSEFLTAPSPVIARQVRFARDVWGRLLGLPQPLICALHGFVLGSGLEIALCCDLRLAADNVRFGLPEVGLGIIPAAGGTQTLPRTIGRARAMEMLLTNRWLDAAEALQIGLVNRVLAPEKLLPAAEELAGSIADLDPMAVRYAKQAVNRGMDLTLEQGRNVEQMLAGRLRAHKFQNQS